jgi:hypothetical protein
MHRMTPLLPSIRFPELSGISRRETCRAMGWEINVPFGVSFSERSVIEAHHHIGSRQHLTYSEVVVLLLFFLDVTDRFSRVT